MNHKSKTEHLTSSLSNLASKAKGNRNVVIVDQKIVKEETSSEPLVFRDDSSVLQHSLSAGYSTESLPRRNHLLGERYSPESSKLSSSSVFINETYVGDMQVSCLEDRLFNELGTEIEATSAQFRQLQTDVKDIAKLRETIEELEKEKAVMAEDISAKDDLIQAMKQRLSVLHEQNNQLAQLTEASGGQSDALRIRNALVASLAQLKKLQVQVDEIPVLKSEISKLLEENTKIKERESDILKRFSISLPEGVAPLDYIKLVEGVTELRSSNSDMSKDVLKMVSQVQVIASSIEEFGGRIDKFEKSLSSDSHMSTYISKLEKEKESLHCEIMKLKLDGSLSCKANINITHLESDCAMLQKNNSLLRSKLEKMALKYRQQKESIILKLFHIQLCSIKAEKCDLEKSLSDFDVANISLSSQQIFGSFGSISTSGLLPQFESQVCKLHQLRLCNKQIRSALQMITFEKDKTEFGFFFKHQDELVKDLKIQVKSYETKLLEALSKIGELENRIRISSQGSLSELLKENATLTAKVVSFRDISDTLQKTQNMLVEEQKSHDVSIQKYKKMKDKKHALEAKLKDSDSIFKKVATELSGSTALLKDYQSQCETLQMKVDCLSKERQMLMDNTNHLKAELEVVKVEYGSNEHPAISAEDIEHEYTTSAPMVTSKMNSTSRPALKDVEHKCDSNSVALTKVHELEEKVVHLLDPKIQYERSSEEHQKEHTFLNVPRITENIQQIFKDYKLFVQKYERDWAHKTSLEEKQLTSKLNGELLCTDEQKVALSERKQKENEYLSVIQGLKVKLEMLKNENQQYQDEKSNLTKMALLKEVDMDKLRDQLASAEAKIVQSNQDMTNLRCELGQKDIELKEVMHQLKQILGSKEQEREAQVTECMKLDKSTNTDSQREEDVSGSKSDIRLCHIEDEVEGYKAIIKSLQRQLDEAETREMEHLHTEQQFKKLEQSIQNNSGDKSLSKNVKVSASRHFRADEESLSDHNLQLEEQVSILSQWNDKQRQQVEQLENSLHYSTMECNRLVADLKEKEKILHQSISELNEIKVEMNALRREADSDMQEELKMKVDTQAHLLAALNEHNTLLHKQVGGKCY